MRIADGVKAGGVDEKRQQAETLKALHFRRTLMFSILFNPVYSIEAAGGSYDVRAANNRALENIG